jgi:Phosphotransferase enzyme family
MGVLVGSPAGVGGVPERLRNWTLRRADWRFLLPTPRPRRSVCYAPGLLARAVEMISESTVDPGTNPVAICDLAVAVDPAPATLHAAWVALGPGGCCYSEWYGAIPGRQQRVHRLLESAGFGAVACYWAWPWPSRTPARFWVPLQAPGGLEYFAGSRPEPRNALRRLGSSIVRFAWRLSTRLGLAVPICAVARKQGSQTSLATPATPNCQLQVRAARGVEPWFFDMIRDGWSDWELGPRPDRLSWLLLTGGQRAISKIVGLVFAEPDSRPHLAVKMPRVSESRDMLRKEAAILRAVHQLRSGGVPGVPRVLFFDARADGAILGETALPGIPLLNLLRRSNYRDFAWKGTRWLSELAGRPQPSPRTTWWDRLVERALGDFVSSFGAIVDTGMLRETSQALASLGDLALVCEQRDFSPWNVLVSPDDQLVVLDWESTELQGLPGLDLLYFLTYLAFFLEDANPPTGRLRESYRKMLDPSTFTGGISAECVAHYADHVGIDRGEFRSLRLLLWMLHSRSEYSHFTADTGGPPGRDKLRDSVFVQLWEQEVRYGR